MEGFKSLHLLIPITFLKQGLIVFKKLLTSTILNKVVVVSLVAS
jgi:hypothetical protein